MTWDLVAVAPVLFFSYVAYCSRVNVDRFHVTEMGAAAHANVSRYIRPVQLVSRLRLNSKTPSSDAEVRAVGREWIRSWRIGVLPDLGSSCYEDTSVDGVKGQIVVARNRLHRSLVEASHHARDAGDEAQAVEDLVCAYEIARILRGSDLSVATSSAAFQTLALQELALLERRPTPSQAARLTANDAPGKLAPRISEMLMDAGRRSAKELDSDRAQGAHTEQCFERFSRIIRNELPTEDARMRMRAMISTVGGENPSLLYAARLAWVRVYEVDATRRRLLGMEPGQESPITLTLVRR